MDRVNYGKKRRKKNGVKFDQFSNKFDLEIVST